MSGPTEGIFGSIAETSNAHQPPTDSQVDRLKGQDQDEDRDVEEEVTNIPGWTPSVTLEVKEIIETGEENEEELYSQRSKLYRFREGEWKERGLGEARLLRSKASGRVRFLLRQEKTGKVVANHYVVDH